MLVNILKGLWLIDLIYIFSNVRTNTICTNTVGSASCACAVGFKGDPYTVCGDVDECAEGKLLVLNLHL